MFKYIRRQLARWALFTIVAVIIDVVTQPKKPEPFTPSDLVVLAGMGGAVMVGSDVLNILAG